MLRISLTMTALSVTGVLLMAPLTALLSACQSSTTPASFALVSGDIVVPPAAGTAEFSGVNGQGQPYPLATTQVDQTGHFTLHLPEPPQRLPAQGNTGLLPFLPSAELVDFKQFTCPQRPVSSDPDARLVLVKLGSYQLAGRLTGELRPAVTAVSGTEDPDRMVTTETYAFADRAVLVSGTLSCTLLAPNGSSVAVPVRVNYDLRPGWNRLTVQTILLKTNQVQVRTQASPELNGVQWWYFPTSP